MEDPIFVPANLNLRKALLQAQMNLKGVEKDAKNTFHKYDYTSSEAMISACRHALHEAGMTAERNEWTYDASICMVVMHFELAHAESGEARRYMAQWPIVEDKGRPFDKALAGALTTSFNYWLRDMLLVPRKDDNEVDKRDDREHAPNYGPPPDDVPFQGPPAKVEQEAEKYDPRNEVHQERLSKVLENRLVPFRYLDDIAMAMKGKPMTAQNLDAVIKRIVK